MAVVSASWVGVDIYCVELDIITELVERLRGGFTTYGSEFGLIKVGLTVVNIGGCHYLYTDQLFRYADKMFKLIS